MKVVMFAAHTDDEMICAGTLHRLVEQGADVHVVTFAPAATENDRTGGKESVGVVRREWESALKAIGVPIVNSVFYTGFTPSIDLSPWRQDFCQIMFEFCERHKPDVAFVLSPFDQNSGHAIVGSAAEEVTRGRVPTVIRCQFPWNYANYSPNLYVKLDDVDLQVKQDVIDCYKSQHFRYQYGRMLINYALADGLSVKVNAAEKFELLRTVL